MIMSRPAVARALSRRRWAALALLACAALATLRVPRSSDLRADFPHHSPTALAHFLADFSNHPKLYTHITGAWGVEEEANNLTSWSYVVRYACGVRCEGRAALSAHTAGAERHRLAVEDSRCSRLPVLPWPQMCESVTTETEIWSRAGGGAQLRERAWTQCGAIALALPGACDVRAARLRHLRALRAALARR